MPSETYQYRRLHGLCVGCGRRKNKRWECAPCQERRAARKGLPPRPTLGERIRQHREAIGYTQGQYGVLVGITGDHVGGLEHGTWKARPSPALQRRLARALGCPVKALKE